MFSIEPWGLGGGDEELAAVGVSSGVGHWEAEGFVLEFEVFVRESFTPDWSSSGTISTCEVTTLNHEAWDDSVELASLEGKFHAIVFEISFTECDKIFDGFGDGVAEHVNNNVARIFSIDVNGEGDSVSGSFLNEW